MRGRWSLGAKAARVSCLVLVGLLPVACLSSLPTPDIPSNPTDDFDGDGLSEEDGDCDDEDAEIYPGAPELCGDGVDADCSGTLAPCSGTL